MLLWAKVHSLPSNFLRIERRSISSFLDDLTGMMEAGVARKRGLDDSLIVSFGLNASKARPVLCIGESNIGVANPVGRKR
jgi:hypothetical protein